MHLRTQEFVSASSISLDALHCDGFCCSFYENADGDSLVDFLKRLNGKFGRILVFADNAGYHKSSHVRKEVRKLGGNVVLRYFPEYTSELNPAEGQWRNTRLHTADRLYESADEMKQQGRCCVRGDRVCQDERLSNVITTVSVLNNFSHSMSVPAGQKAAHIDNRIHY